MKNSALLKAKNKRVSFFALILILFYNLPLPAAQKDFADLVDPMIGCAKLKGDTVIGPQQPFGSVNPSPHTFEGFEDGFEPGKPIKGFAQIHASGVGWHDYGNFLVSPQIGLNTASDGHDSNYADLKAKPYQLSVMLKKYNIGVEIAPAHYSAIYKFTYPASAESTLLFDVTHNIAVNIMGGYFDRWCKADVTVNPEDASVSGYFEMAPNNTLPPFNRLYFYAQTKTKPSAVGTFYNDKIFDGVHSQKLKVGTDRLGAYFRFKTKCNETILMRIGVSLVSVKRAKKLVLDEIRDWDFERVAAQCKKQWNERLSKIAIDDPQMTDQQRTRFYTDLYHSMLMPRDRTKDVPWETDAPYWDDHYCIWDTFRTVFPLHALINPEVVRDNVRSFVDRSRHQLEVSDAFIAGRNRGRQGGDDVDNVIADACVKGIEGIDWQEAYSLMRYHAEHWRTRTYRENDRGWVVFGDGIDKHNFNSSSLTLEFAYNDFCIAQVAKKLGITADAEKYLKRSRQWTNLWNSKLENDGFTGFIAAKSADGQWQPVDVNQFQDYRGPYFYEGSSWSYSFFAPHDFARLAELMGGRDRVIARIDHAFNKGLVKLNNEPCFLIPFICHYVGMPDKTREKILYWLNSLPADGFIDDEDSGAMSSWSVFAKLGIFPNAGQDFYYIHGPLIKKSIVSVGSNKFTIIAENLSAENKYIEKITLNDKPLNRAWLRHSEIVKGGTLIVTYGKTEQKWDSKESLPPSL